MLGSSSSWSERGNSSVAERYDKMKAKATKYWLTSGCGLKGHVLTWPGDICEDNAERHKLCVLN